MRGFIARVLSLGHGVESYQAAVLALVKAINRRQNELGSTEFNRSGMPKEIL
jgi:hypothetical protein